MMTIHLFDIQIQTVVTFTNPNSCPLQFFLVSDTFLLFAQIPSSLSASYLILVSSLLECLHLKYYA